MADDTCQLDRPRLSLAEQLTENFYLWERRGRGWKLWEDAVDIEPAYEPFYHYPLYYPFGPVVDDGRRPTFLSSLWDRFIGRPRATVRGRSQEELAYLPTSPYKWELEEPALFSDTGILHELTVSLSPKIAIDIENAERLLLNLSFCQLPLSFEVVGTPEEIFVRFVCRDLDFNQTKLQLQAYFPDAVLYKQLDSFQELWDEKKHIVIADFGLCHEFMRPLKTFRNVDPDPLTGLVGALQDLAKGETGMLQVLFKPVRHPWAEDITRSVTDWQGHHFFGDFPAITGLAKDKIERPLFAVVIRAAGQSPSSPRAWEIMHAVAAGLVQMSYPPSNELMPLSNDGYDDYTHAEDLFLRRSHRGGMLLNSRELVALVHPPSVSVRAAKLRRELKKTKAAPDVATGHQFVLGENIHQGQSTEVTLSRQQRLRHMHIIGATGTGKSTLLLRLIAQDIEKGNGVAVLDPHGDLIDRVMEYVPEQRFEDVILLDPSDTDYPVGLNILSAYSDLDKRLLSSDLVSVFRRLSTSWGDQMNSIFGNAILAFLESTQGGTLMELRRFLVETDFRRRFLQTVQDQEVLYYWQKEFPLLKGRLQAPILTRLDTFLRPRCIRYMVCQKEGLDFRAILDGRKIFLGKLAQGLIGMENAYLLGTLIVSKFHQAALARQAQAITERQASYLYIDEFQNFVTESMTEILSGARKYGFGLILAHQEMRQLWSRDIDLAHSVISNPGTRICFRLGDFDAKKLEDGFSTFEAQDFQSLSVGEAIARIERADYDFNLKTFMLQDVPAELGRQRLKKLIDLSRRKYAGSRPQIESELLTSREQIIKEKPAPEIQQVCIEEIKEDKKQEVLQEEKPLYYRPKRKEEPTVEGIGGSEHTKLQADIKDAAQRNNFMAIIEQPTPDGSGKIDVHIERDNVKFACEICVTTTSGHEIDNIKKCLAAGYDRVILCSNEKKTLDKVKKLASKNLKKPERQKVLFLLRDGVFAYLEQEAAKAETAVQRIKGYLVESHHEPVSEEKQEAKRKSIAKALWRFRKPKDKPKDKKDKETDPQNGPG